MTLAFASFTALALAFTFTFAACARFAFDSNWTYTNGAIRNGIPVSDNDICSGSVGCRIDIGWT